MNVLEPIGYSTPKICFAVISSSVNVHTENWQSSIDNPNREIAKNSRCSLVFDEQSDIIFGKTQKNLDESNSFFA